MGKYQDVVTTYAERVLEGEEPTCKFVKWACQRHLNDLRRSDIVLDPDEILRVCNFVEMLPHTKGGKAGKPLLLEPAQKFILGSVFGWRRKSDGFRRFRYSYTEIPRKNGKSTLASGVALYGLVGDGEKGAEVYSAATTREQSKIVWDASRDMVRASPLLSRMVKTYHSSLIYQTSKFVPLSADAKTKDGLNPHIVVIDELHAWPNRDLWDVIVSALGSRDQPVVFVITTAGVDTLGICYEQRSHVLRTLDPNSETQSDDWFGYIATLDGHDGVFDSKEEQKVRDDHTDPKVWVKANFLIDRGKKRDYLQGQVREGEQLASKRNDVLTKQFDIWCETKESWLSVAKWDENARKIDLEKLAGKRCCSGMDLSSNTDLTAHVLIFLRGVYKELAIVPFLYLPEDNMRERMKRDRVPYDQWVKAGHIKTTPGDAIDLAFIKQDYRDLAAKFEILETGFDPWKAAELATELGNEGATMVEMRQGHGTLGYPTRKFEEFIIKKTLWNNGNPALRWMAQNVTVRRDENENIVPDKKKARMRIDGIVAAIMALGRVLSIDDAPSKYEDELPLVY